MGTSVATSAAAQAPQAPMLATSCAGRLASASASPSAGPATRGSASQATRTGHAEWTSAARRPRPDVVARGPEGSVAGESTARRFADRIARSLFQVVVVVVGWGLNVSEDLVPRVAGP